jgi:hypothetical protein
VVDPEANRVDVRRERGICMRCERLAALAKVGRKDISATEIARLDGEKDDF